MRKIVVGCVIVLVVLYFGGRYVTKNAVVGDMRQFIHAADTQDIDTVYNYFTERTRQSISLEIFDTALATAVKEGIYSSDAIDEIEDIDLGCGMCLFLKEGTKVKITTKDHFVEFVREGDEWKLSKWQKK
ncbi:MAG: hypothetical protein KAR24_01750 [Candidatus Pacebacteria bacterium]|nr:hypothetical protein [Candidatus Paceibacterota bacterium]